jgi:hypothetical protein
VKVTPGLQQSLLIQLQRRLLDEAGAKVGTPVVYLKAAWADPVLYGGSGERTGTDLDVLVRPSLFKSFGKALDAVGFVRHREPWHMVTHRLIGKAWLYQPPPNALPVDLHRNLSDSPWFSIPINDWIDRAISYDSVDGPILSLAPEDQVIYASSHYASHRYTLGPQHLNDVVRLLAAHSVNWQVIKHRAQQGDIRLPLALFVDALRQRGVSAPDLVSDPSFVAPWRVAYVRRWLRLEPKLQRPSSLSSTDLIGLMPVLSGNPTALPHFAARFALVRALDCGEELLFRMFS